MDTELSGKTAIVTGAASGIGHAAVTKLTEEGARVLAVDRDGDALATIGKDETRCRTLRADVTDPAGPDHVVAAAAEFGGRVDILINNAGVGIAGSVTDTTTEQWDTMFAVNARAPFLLCRAAITHMLADGQGGTLVNVASAAGLSAVGNRAAYCASKGAVIALTKAIAVDYGKSGIRANAVAPGTVDTPWINRVLDGASDPSATREAMAQRQIVGRLGQAEEVADAIVYLSSARASFLHGSTLVVDGGFHAR